MHSSPSSTATILEAIPATMRVAKALDFGHTVIEEVPVPTIGPKDALVKMASCGICAGDVTPWYIKKKCPIVLGHEPCGTIVALGSEVSNFQVGQRVFVHHHAPCFKCRHCERKNYSMCATWRSSNIVPGGIAEYIQVPEVNLQGDTIVLPDSVSWDIGSLIEPVACVVKAFHRSRIRKGDRLAIIGLGFIGQVMVRLARHYGASMVMASDLVPYRLEKAREAGADLVVDASNQDFTAEIMKATNGFGADVVMVGPSKPAVFQQAIQCAGKGSTVLLFMSPPPGVMLEVEPFKIFFDEIDLVSSYSCGPNDTRETLQLFEKGILRPEDFITHRFPLAETAAACELTAAARDSLKVVVENR